jgi:transposase-like protein
MLNQMAQNDPQVRKVLQMMQGKSPAELRRIADNIAAERGTTVEDVARQLGITIPSNR